MNARHKYGATLVVTLVGSALVLFVDLVSRFDVAAITLSDGGIRAAVFGSLIALAGLILTVMLGILAVLTTLEERPIVRLMKELNRYVELIARLIGPVKSVFVLAALSILCLLVPEVKEKDTWDIGARSILVTVTLMLALGLMVQTASVAKLLADIMLHNPAEPDASDSPEAARARLRTPQPAEKKPARSSAELAVVS